MNKFLVVYKPFMGFSVTDILIISATTKEEVKRKITNTNINMKLANVDIIDISEIDDFWQYSKTNK